jgi:hypothetical protein
MLFKDAGLKVMDNTPEEVLALIREMHESLNGGIEYSREDEQLQSSFRSMLRPNNRNYGTPARIGSAYLRTHPELLE